MIIKHVCSQREVCGLHNFLCSAKSCGFDEPTLTSSEICADDPSCPKTLISFKTISTLHILAKNIKRTLTALLSVD